MRAIDDKCFAAALSSLRDATQKAMTVLQCSICPSRLVWAMQNAQLLNTLILSIAGSYQRAVGSLELETARAESLNETKSIWFGEVRQNGTENGTGTDQHPSFTISLSPSEWQKLSKKAAKDEIYGAPHTSSTSFWSVLQAMENRQIEWHSICPPANLACQAPGLPHHGEPLCVMLVRQAKGVITRLPLDD